MAASPGAEERPRARSARWPAAPGGGTPCPGPWRTLGAPRTRAGAPSDSRDPEASSTNEDSLSSLPFESPNRVRCGPHATERRPRRPRRPPRRCGGARPKATCRSTAPPARSCAARAPGPRRARAAATAKTAGAMPRSAAQFRRRAPRRARWPRAPSGPSPLLLRRQELPRPRPSHRPAPRRVARSARHPGRRAAAEVHHGDARTLAHGPAERVEDVAGHPGVPVAVLGSSRSPS